MIAKSSIASMVIAITLLVAILVIVFFGLKKKFAMKIVPIFIGAFFFVLFAMVLEQKLHMLVLKPTATGAIALKAHYPWLYVLYGVLAAGVFEETARFAGFHLLKQQYPKFSTSIAYGFGHGGIEMVLVGILSLVNSLILSLMLQDPNGTLAQELPQSVIVNLQNTPVAHIYLTVIERFAALVIQISLSILVWFAVNKKEHIGFYPLAILIHAVIDTPSAMLQAKLLNNIFVVYVLLYLMAGLLIFAVYRLIKKEFSKNSENFC